MSVRPSRSFRALRAALAVVLSLVATVGPAVAHGPGDSREKMLEVQRLLGRGAFTEAIEVLDHVERDHPHDEVIARVLYWRAFALWRMGDDERLVRATVDLRRLVREFPDVAVRIEARTLCERVARALMQAEDPVRAAEIGELVQVLVELEESTNP